MNVAPVIVRELRAEARNSMNYGMRLVAVAVLMFVMGNFIWPYRSYYQGREIFALTGLMTFLGIGIFTPLLASDCLSRERREGTLGLLFLTPLRPIEIVLGKGFIHLLRGLALITATIPVLTIPFLLGGVTGSDVLRVLCLYGTALFLSLAAGILASSLCQNWSRSVVLTVLVLSLFAYMFVYLPVAIPGFGWRAIFGVDNYWDNVLTWLFLLDGGTGRLAGKFNPLQAAALLCLVSLLVFGCVVIFAAWRLRLTWQDQPLTVRQVRWRKVF